VTHDLKLRHPRVWARQLNIESEGTHLLNDGGRNEVLGGFSYTTTAGRLAPMIVNDNSSVFAFFSEVCNNGDPSAQRIKETRGTETKLVDKDEGGISPYAGDWKDR